MTTVAASTAAAASLLLYANHSLGISKDLKQYRLDASWTKRFPQFLAKLGADSPHLYRMLEQADPNADALWFEGRTWNYRAMKQQVDELAVGLLDLGVQNGDIVAVFMTNSPEMVFTVYALTKLGAAPALINNALRDETLLHCVRLPASSLILTTPDLATHAASAAKSLSDSIKTVRLNVGSFRPTTTTPLSLDQDIIDFPFPEPSRTTSLPLTPPKTLASTAALIYTSGTTGKPKACSVKNALVCVVSNTTSADADNPKKYLTPLRTYSCMPVFHGTTFFTGLCYSAAQSGCFCVGRKFSARNFWKEVSECRATRVLYVGELVRFILATSPGQYDRAHNVLVAAGNGLQKDVWVDFQRRFNVKEIREFYRSTEGLVKFDNIHYRGRPGAGRVGYMGVLRKQVFDKGSQAIVRFDYDTENPVRDAETGFCVVAARGEPGEAIAKIRDMATYTNYHGNVEATENKLLRDVFEKGDVWQRSGDLLVQESNGWVKFVDRIGDTYRWMGENVSAGEVRGFISELPGVKDAVVVGRRLEKYDGQAGTALIVLDAADEKQGSGMTEVVFMGRLFKELRGKGVPRYAVPRLVMVRDELVDVGDTFKHAKNVVKNIDWAGGDGLGRKYYLDLQDERYKRLDPENWSSIEQGRAKL
ncbi:fatty-acyl-CoA synthase [Exophiala viscosa]|uniref:Fatty-acyl-CoA synthase n=1 Tax=Exophiala viscosa TaxID=2486360 RepID=A0AAN6DRA9_9EURO|nr:fatty-acyl-CoA synthase [Exophiala viscosa]